MKILIIQLAKIGDLLQSKKLIDVVKNTYQNSQIFVLHDEKFKSVVDLLPNQSSIPLCIDSIAELTNGRFNLINSEATHRLITILNRFSFDLVINLNSSGLAVQISERINYKRIGFASNDKFSTNWLYYWMSFIKSRKFSSINLVDLYAGIIKTNYENNFCFSWNNSPKDILIQIGTRNFKRQPQAKLIAEIARKLKRKNANVTLIGAKEDRNQEQEILSYYSNIRSLVGKTTLTKLIERISQADLLITGDTGPMHIAANRGTQILALFMGPAFPYETVGYSENVKVLKPKQKSFSCYPCEDEYECPRNLACHKPLKASEVISAIFGKSELELQPYFDEIGMNFTDTEFYYENFVAHIFRSFALHRFKNKDSKLNLENSYLEHFNHDWKVSKILLKRESDPLRFPFPFVFYWKQLLGEDIILDFEKWFGNIIVSKSESKMNKSQ